MFSKIKELGLIQGARPMTGGPSVARLYIASILAFE